MTYTKLSPSDTQEYIDYFLSEIKYEEFDEEILREIVNNEDSVDHLSDSDLSDLFDVIEEAYDEREYEEELLKEEERDREWLAYLNKLSKSDARYLLNN